MSRAGRRETLDDVGLTVEHVKVLARNPISVFVGPGTDTVTFRTTRWVSLVTLREDIVETWFQNCANHSLTVMDPTDLPSDHLIIRRAVELTAAARRYQSASELLKGLKVRCVTLAMDGTSLRYEYEP